MKTTGIIKFKIDGEPHWVSGGIEYTTGAPKREELVTSDGTVMRKETPTAATVEGKTQDRSDFEWNRFQTLENVNIVLEAGNGKTYQFLKCFYADEGKGSTESGEMNFKFVAEKGCQEVTS